MADAQPVGPKPTRIEPPITETSAPFWDATRREQLVLQWCTECDRPIWFPREVCPRCMSSSLEWRPASGRGEVYSFTVENKPGPRSPFLGSPRRDASDAEEDEPQAESPYGGRYTIALIALEEGVRLMSNVVGDPDAVAVGRAVTVTWEPLSDGRNLPLFALAESG
jgi:uncharacterized OB-fold protein